MTRLRDRLVPASLKGRLLLFLIGGLVVAQIASSLIAYYDRRGAVERVVARRNAVRIADFVRMLDGLTPDERDRAVAALRYPLIRVGNAAYTDPRNLPEAFATEPAPNEPIESAMVTAFLQRLEPPRAVYVQVAKTVLRYSPESAATLTPTVTGVEPQGWGVFVRSTLADQSPVLIYVEVPFVLPSPLSSLLWQLVVPGAVIVLLIGFAVTWVTRPLGELADAAGRLGNDLEAPPLPERGTSELRRAARAFNSMQERLSRYVKSRVTALTAISHDLKTPITRMRLRAELIEDESLRAALLRDMEQLEKTVYASLEFIRGLESTERVQPTDLNALIESVCEDYRAAGHDVTMAGTVAEPLRAQPQALKHCLVNIIDNACKYGGKAKVELVDGDSETVIKVRDFGNGVPEPELEKVFEPFYRVETSRSRDTGGTGLGLSIARNIAQLHRGWISIRNHPEGGLEATLALPRA
jgi:signal transduction histidine kinase